MSDAVVEKTWEVPAHGGKWPVTVTLRMPDVTITDSQGRHIVISPEQATIVSSKMSDIAYWFEDIKEAAGDRPTPPDQRRRYRDHAGTTA